jgi:hypothetical protein
MAEVKNTFLQAKMNLDLDDRILPNGQYREAYNVITGKSEDNDIGALENISGNVLLVNTNLRVSLNKPNLDSIGYLVDSNKNRIIVFLTDNDSELGVLAPSTSFCAIYMYTVGAITPYIPLVTGSFLNFSKKNPIYGVNIIEDLLFWTDDRNQPRKINVALAPGGHYTSEVQISVAKYNPYEVISLVKTVKATVVTTPTTTTFTVDDATGLEVGMTVIGPDLDGSNYTFIKTIAGTLITIDADPTPGNITIGDELIFLISTMTNQESASPAWPGDPDYLQSRYVRFGYRFKFEDGEYSIVSPFTQIAYIPEQKGFFVAGDEDAAYRSTVLNFMQNNVQNVELLIPLPDTYNNIGDSYKITEIDVLYKESDQTTIKVLESIVIAQNALPGDEGDINVFTYNYQSRKPYKTLPEAQTVRVYDKVPTRALAQETAGNRVIYGNYRDAYTPPLNISYTIGVAKKEIDYADGSSAFIEYPNHTLKENRNYQVGFILSDKYGRQSSVLLSPVTSEAEGGFGGSTVYSPYKSAGPGMLEWFGDTLIVSVNAPITSGINGQPDFNTGEPGLYAAPNANGNLGFAIISGSFTTTAPFLYTFILDTDPDYAANNIVPVANLTSLRGGNVDYVKVINRTGTGTALDPYIVTTDGVINSMYNHNPSAVPDIKYAYTINEIGWYSYKVVVKQFEQDYYNCYLPGMLNDYPEQSDPLPETGAFPSGEVNKTAHIVLLNDNINKIPRDLTEVGPDQKQYRSSVLLYGRVENNTGTTNIQYYPGRLFDIASTIANANDLNMTYAALGGLGQQNLYQIDTQPIIARISTSNPNNPIGVTTTTMRPVLSIYETKPVESLLNIYWETSTVGLISDLNEQALTGFEGPVGFSDFTYSQKEHQDPAGTGTIAGEPDSRFVTPAFFITSPGPVNLPTAIVTSFSVIDGNGSDVTAKFSYVQSPGGEIRIRINEAFTYLKGSSTKDVFTFSFGVSLTTPQGILTNTLTAVGSLENIEPYMFPEPTLFQVIQAEDFVGQLTNTFNGAFADEDAQIYFVIDSITGPDTSPTPFTINPVTGVISQTADSDRALGTYNLSVKFYDATMADGSSIPGEPKFGVVNFDIDILPNSPTEGAIVITNSPQINFVRIENVTIDGDNVSLNPGYDFPVLPNTTALGTYTIPISGTSTVVVYVNLAIDAALTVSVDGIGSCQLCNGANVFTGVDLLAGGTLSIILATEGDLCS